MTATSPSSATAGLAEALSVGALRDQRSATCAPVGAPTITSDLSENIILTSLDDPAALSSSLP
jgi:NAD(P)H-quinone oxidoreductase subunit K